MQYQLETYIEELPGMVSFEMVKVEGGTFDMGSKYHSREQPIHKVKVSDFYIGKFLVIQAVWTAIMKKNPSQFKRHNNPVERVSWLDAQIFLRKLYGLTGTKYRLPSEAEWEYAARSGRYNQRLRYVGSNNLKEVGWYSDNSNDQSHPVGLKLPNELGLYDMSGNVREWCADHWHENHKGAPNDGTTWVNGGDKDMRVVRGGSWNYTGESCRPSNRVDYNVNLGTVSIGFRLARSCPPKDKNLSVGEYL